MDTNKYLVNDWYVDTYLLNAAQHSQFEQQKTSICWLAISKLKFSEKGPSVLIIFIENTLNQ